MKVSRTQNVIQIEVEAADCPGGYTPEMVADAIEQGIRLQMERGLLPLPDIQQHPEVQQVMQDFKQRWEIG